MSEDVEPHVRLAAGALTAILVLYKCLRKSGVPEDGVFAQSLKDTYNHPDARWDDLDYAFLRQLALVIEKHDAGEPT